MFDPIDSANEAAAQRQIDYDMRHAGVHPIFAGILDSMCPPPDDGQQRAQAEPEQPWIPPIEHLEQGGYRYEARLMREALAALQCTVDLLARYPNHDEAWRQGRAVIAKLKGEQP